MPSELIAQEPLADRAASRLLWLHRDSGSVEHRAFRDIPSILREGDLLVMNDTRVTARRLLGNRASGGRIEALLLREIEPGVHLALMRPAKRLRLGEKVEFEDGVEAEVVGTETEGRRLLRFPAGVNLAACGQVPLPPYIRVQLEDPERYQTVYSRHGGSAAAPTAGLHFTPEVFAALRAVGVEIAFVTLDVGVDTFRPLTVTETLDHKMHGERCCVPPETAAAIARCRGRVIAGGTTVVRTLESFAVGPRQVESGSTLSDIFIQPGHEFSAIDGMLTNFHMPRTTMLMMISALAGRDQVMAAYAEAVDKRYRFLSFGDSMLVL